MINSNSCSSRSLLAEKFLLMWLLFLCPILVFKYAFGMEVKKAISRFIVHGRGHVFRGLVTHIITSLISCSGLIYYVRSWPMVRHSRCRLKAWNGVLTCAVWVVTTGKLEYLEIEKSYFRQKDMECWTHFLSRAIFASGKTPGGFGKKSGTR